MPNYKLVYFNVRGRAETIRYIFAVAGVEYTDARFEQKDWPVIKDLTPFGQVPLLEVDGRTICQTHAIERFLARRFGLFGKTALDNARVDMIVDCLQDYANSMTVVITEQDPDKKKEKLETFKEEVPKYLTNLQKILKKNAAWWSGNFVGSQLTLADIGFYQLIESSATFLGEDVPETWGKWPALKKVKDTVHSHPRIQEWIAKRPKTRF